MSVASKLSYLGETKEQIREGLNKLGGNISKNDTFRSYADKINEIYDSMPKVEETDVESATLEGTIKGGLTINLKGNTSQTGTPTPSTPIPVNVVSGDNEVVVCGKNLLPFTNQDFTLKNIHYFTQDGSLYVNGTSTGETSTSDANFKNNFSFTLQAGTYTFSQQTNNSLSKYIKKYDDNTNISIINGSNHTNTFTLNVETKVYLGFYVYNFSTTNENLQIMLELSSTATTYEPYQSQTYPINLPVENLINYLDVKGLGARGDDTIYSDNTSINDDVLTISQSYAANGGILKFNTKPTNYVKSGEKITISFIPTNSANITIGIANYNGGGTNNLQQNVSVTANVRKTITLEALSNYDNLGIFLQPQSVNTTLSLKDLMVERGSKANSYTPYGTTPIELCKIGTYQDKFIRNSGKNLLSVSFSQYNETQLRTAQFDLSAGTYTFSFEVASTTGNQVSFYKVADGNTTLIAYKYTSKTLTATLEAGTYFISIYQTGILLNNISQPMLNEGETALPYEPYGTGQWCKYNAIGKVVLDGSEEWTQRNTGDGSTTISFNRNISGIGSTSQMNNRFPNSTGSTDGNEGLGIPSQLVQLYVQIKRSRLSSVDVTGFRSWLASNSTTVYYVLATPYLSLIEDNNLIEQLDNLQNAMSYEGTTNINQVNNDLPFKLDVKAILDWRN